MLSARKSRRETRHSYIRTDFSFPCPNSSLTIVRVIIIKHFPMAKRKRTDSSETSKGQMTNKNGTAYRSPRDFPSDSKTAAEEIGFYRSKLDALAQLASSDLTRFAEDGGPDLSDLRGVRAHICNLLLAQSIS